MKVFWILKRVSVMRPKEIVFRIGELYTLFLMRLKYVMNHQLAEKPLDYHFLKLSSEQLPQFYWRKPSSKFKSHVLKGSLILFHRGKEWQLPEGKNRWLSAPDTGRIWDDQFFGDIPFRQGNSVGDIRVLWEPARLQHLIAVSLLMRDSDNEVSHLELVKLYIDHVISFDKLNRPLKGPHYVSSMECALRIISLLISYDLGRETILNKSENPDEIRAAIANIVVGHAWFVFQRLSLHSSAGNHVLAEASGLFLAGLYFPEHQEAQKWYSKGLTLFTTHIERQVDESGWGREGATWYLRQILDYAHLIISCLRHRGMKVPGPLLDAYERGNICQELLTKRIGSYPVIGDSDSGWAVSEFFLRSSGEEVVSIRETNYSEFTRAVVAGKGVGLSALINYGDLGMGPTFGHGHAHALSVALYSGGEPILADPGTYSYTGHPEMRRYFRSTSAHNTVSVNGEDQAQQDLLFMWSKPYISRALLVKQIGTVVAVVATHNGYDEDGVQHHRLFLFDPKSGLYVEDWLKSISPFTCDLVWNVNGAIEGSEILAAGTVLDYKIKVPETAALSIKEGPLSDSYHQYEMHPRIEVSCAALKEVNIQSCFFEKSVEEGWYLDARDEVLQLFPNVSGHSKKRNGETI